MDIPVISSRFSRVPVQSKRLTKNEKFGELEKTSHLAVKALDGTWLESSALLIDVDRINGYQAQKRLFSAFFYDDLLPVL